MLPLEGVVLFVKVPINQFYMEIRARLDALCASEERISRFGLIPSRLCVESPEGFIDLYQPGEEAFRKRILRQGGPRSGEIGFDILGKLDKEIPIAGIDYGSAFAQFGFREAEEHTATHGPGRIGTARTIRPEHRAWQVAQVISEQCAVFCHVATPFAAQGSEKGGSAVHRNYLAWVFRPAAQATVQEKQFIGLD